MKQISSKEYERYQQYLQDKTFGRILTPDGLRFLCESMNNDPEEIGKHMILMVQKFRSEGLFDLPHEEE